MKKILMKKTKCRISFWKNIRNFLGLGLEKSIPKNIRNFYFSGFASFLLKFMKTFFWKKYKSFLSLRLESSISRNIRKIFFLKKYKKFFQSECFLSFELSQESHNTRACYRMTKCAEIVLEHKKMLKGKDFLFLTSG